MTVGQPQVGSGSIADAATSAPGVYYLAPHADDVVLSCAGHVRSDVEAGHKVTLVTVFLSGRDADTRRAEDERAAAILGCQYLSLGLFDAADRPEVRGRLGVFGAFGPPHLGITSEVVARLLWHITAPAALCAPLAVGGHIDHRIVHEAARALCYQQRLTLSYYEDQPYSLAPYALGRRLAALETAPLPELPGTERASPGSELRAVRDFYRQLPLLRSLLPGGRFLGGHLMARAVLAAESTGQRPGVRPELKAQLREVSAYRPVRTAALAAYASQWPQFADSPEALETRLHHYGQRLYHASPGASAPAPPALATYERLWQDLAMGPAGDLGVYGLAAGGRDGTPGLQRPRRRFRSRKAGAGFAQSHAPKDGSPHGARDGAGSKCRCGGDRRDRGGRGTWHRGGDRRHGGRHGAGGGSAAAAAGRGRVYGVLAGAGRGAVRAGVTFDHPRPGAGDA